MEDTGDIQALLNDLASTVAQQKVDIMFLKRENQAQAAKLKELEQQKTEREQQGKQVVFSAAMFREGEGTTGPFPDHMTLVYKHVVTNIGNAYNPNTGVFTAPVRGIYHFEWHLVHHGNPAHASGIDLMKNSARVFMAWERNNSGTDGSSSNGVYLLLEVGEVVFLRLYKGTTVYDNQGHHTTFSGHLLFPMSGDRCFMS